MLLFYFYMLHKLKILANLNLIMKTRNLCFGLILGTCSIELVSRSFPGLFDLANQEWAR